MIIDVKTNRVLKNLEKTQHDFWNISHATGNFLNMLIKMVNAKNAVEVGTSNGYSGIWLAKALKETGGHLTTIEYYEKRIVLAQENFKTCGVADIIDIKQGSAIEILEQIPEDEIIDFAFIDANKAQYIDYFYIIDKHMKSGAIITADNITSHAEKVKTFVDAIQGNKNYQVEILDLPAGLLVARKI
ncbi:O-methyltransferase [bacterium]|nr:O-methyltransferase [bacterium]